MSASEWSTLSVKREVGERFREFRDQHDGDTTDALRKLLDARGPDSTDLSAPRTHEEQRCDS